MSSLANVLSVGKQFEHVLFLVFGQMGPAAQVALLARSHPFVDVAFASLLAKNFTGAGNLEATSRCLIRLHLGHECCSEVIVEFPALADLIQH